MAGNSFSTGPAETDDKYESLEGTQPSNEEEIFSESMRYFRQIRNLYEKIEYLKRELVDAYEGYQESTSSVEKSTASMRDDVSHWYNEIMQGTQNKILVKDPGPARVSGRNSI